MSIRIHSITWRRSAKSGWGILVMMISESEAPLLLIFNLRFTSTPKRISILSGPNSKLGTWLDHGSSCISGTVSDHRMGVRGFYNLNWKGSD